MLLFIKENQAIKLKRQDNHHQHDHPDLGQQGKINRSVRAKSKPPAEKQGDIKQTGPHSANKGANLFAHPQKYLTYTTPLHQNNSQELLLPSRLTT